MTRREQLKLDIDGLTARIVGLAIPLAREEERLRLETRSEAREIIARDIAMMKKEIETKKALVAKLTKEYEALDS